jgi:hypothetical protein
LITSFRTGRRVARCVNGRFFLAPQAVVIGGAAALDGAPVNPYHLDVVHSRAPENIPRLLDALKEFDAYDRHHLLRLTPNESHLVSEGHQLLVTRFAALDLPGSVAEQDL